MSSLFIEPMHGMLVANYSGIGPETPEQEANRLQAEARSALLCGEDWDWGFPCGEPKGHEGDHVSRGDGGSWEMRWRPND